MRLLALLHRWTGGFAGLLLAIIGASGTALLWEDQWIGVPHAGDPLSASPTRLASIVAHVAADPSPQLSRITFASDTIGVHQAIFAGGGGAYLSQSGTVVEQWPNQWHRPELWLFDLHHHLFAGAAGETITGVAGLLGLFFVASGSILWWRTRRTFRFRVLPPRLTKSAIVRQHRDLGIVAAPLLFVSMLSGVLMVFVSLSSLVLSPWSEGGQPVRTMPIVSEAGAFHSGVDWARLFASAHTRFPGASFRRLQMPDGAGKPIVLRMRQPFEWTPNGRTFLYFDPANARLMAIDDPAKADGANMIHEKLYPVHAAKVGGVIWRVLLSLSGLSLCILGGLGCYSFWFGRSPSVSKRAKRQT